MATWRYEWRPEPTTIEWAERELDAETADEAAAIIRDIWPSLAGVTVVVERQARMDDAPGHDELGYFAPDGRRLRA